MGNSNQQIHLSSILTEQMLDAKRFRNFQIAILDGIREEFEGEPYDFQQPNNPIECYHQDAFLCQVRIDLLKNTVEIWVPSGFKSGSAFSGFKDSCRPYKSWPLEAPDSFDNLYKTIRRFGDDKRR